MSMMMPGRPSDSNLFLNNLLNESANMNNLASSIFTTGGTTHGGGAGRRDPEDKNLIREIYDAAVEGYEKTADDRLFRQNPKQWYDKELERSKNLKENGPGPNDPDIHRPMRLSKDHPADDLKFWNDRQRWYEDEKIKHQKARGLRRDESDNWSSVINTDTQLKTPSKDAFNRLTSNAIDGLGGLLNAANKPLQAPTLFDDDKVKKAGITFNESSSDIKNLLAANGIVNRYEQNWETRFSRIGIIDPYTSKTSTKEFIFFTRPDLCLYRLASDPIIVPELAAISPFLKENLNRYKRSAMLLQCSASNLYKGYLMPLLTNACKSTLDIPGLSADMVETATNIKGSKISYRGSSYKSDEDLDFSLEFEDTKSLDIYMMFRIWDEYERLKWNGQLQFNKWSGCERWTNYTINKILHDQISIYKIVVGEDGHKILFMARATGVVPTSIPRDAFADMSDNDPQKITVGFKGHWVRDMDPIIPYQFNQVNHLGRSLTFTSPLYTSDKDGYKGINPHWPACPYIKIVESDKLLHKKEYYLDWLV